MKTLIQRKAASAKGEAVFDNPEESEDEPDFTNSRNEPSNDAKDCDDDQRILPMVANQSQKGKKSRRKKDKYAIMGSIPECRKYRPEDLYPKKKPYDSESFTLSAYHPVYVGNFKVIAWDEKVWYEQISSYFAYKGLLTRMVYFHQNKNDSFTKFQEVNRLIDMLVYFTTELDANQAVKLCHRDVYYGHKLNVLPGRKPQCFDIYVTVRFLLPTDEMHNKTESIVEEELGGQVTHIMQDSVRRTVVQFVSKKAMLTAISRQSSYIPIRTYTKTKKQRFLEEDATQRIECAIQTYPSFMEMKPAPSILQSLYDGTRPSVDTSWMNHDKPLMADEEFHSYKQQQQSMLREMYTESSLNGPNFAATGPIAKIITTEQTKERQVSRGISTFLHNNRQFLIKLQAKKLAKMVPLAKNTTRDKHTTMSRRERKEQNRMKKMEKTVTGNIFTIGQTSLNK
ncbi:uncharacterized protein LOC131685358 [Topomyia yanbarensis]|uniref:uncharacterized protein LOC131685358 n=1 Tax=Topomyia yanbarensis TaxID=2498891 RepID=UPI00273BF6A8|nr:uncharacterized protein LOC131685358 [Topomyia yanbarensis]